MAESTDPEEPLTLLDVLLDDRGLVTAEALRAAEQPIELPERDDWIYSYCTVDQRVEALSGSVMMYPEIWKSDRVFVSRTLLGSLVLEGEPIEVDDELFVLVENCAAPAADALDESAPLISQIGPVRVHGSAMGWMVHPADRPAQAPAGFEPPNPPPDCEDLSDVVVVDADPANVVTKPDDSSSSELVNKPVATSLPEDEYVSNQKDLTPTQVTDGIQTGDHLRLHGPFIQFMPGQRHEDLQPRFLPIPAEISPYGQTASGEQLFGLFLDEDHLVRGLNAFVNAGPMDGKVFNLSFGSPGCGDVDSPYIDALACVIDTIEEKGGFVIASAGNDEMDQPVYPAAFHNVIGVGSVDAAGALSTFSNFGNWVNTYRVGEEIAAEFKAGQQGAGSAQVLWSGTSFAAPQVAMEIVCADPSERRSVFEGIRDSPERKTQKEKPPHTPEEAEFDVFVALHRKPPPNSTD